MAHNLDLFTTVPALLPVKFQNCARKPLPPDKHYATYRAIGVLIRVIVDIAKIG